MELRLVDASEAALVHQIMMEAFEEYRTQANPSSALRESIEDVRTRLAEGGGVIADEGGEAVASGRFLIVDGGLTFERLAVLPSHRGAGIARAMIRYLESHARALGLDIVRCDARSQQPDNRSFYLALGYEIIGYEDRYGIAGLKTLMAKRLSRDEDLGA